MTKVEKKQLPAFLVLTIISLVAALVLAVTNEVTKGPIAAHAAAERNRAFAAVLPAASYNEMTIPEGHASVTGLFEAVDENGATLGYTVVASASGYAGPVAVTLGVGNDGMVTGAVIGDTSFAETAGFGMKWKEETDRWEQFTLIDTEKGGSIEAITGATVTSGAVLNATNAAVNCINEVRGVAARDVVEKGTPAAPVVEQVALEGGIHEGSHRGFASDVRVQLTMDDAGVVTGLNIDAMGETMGFGTRATTEPEFAQQFIGKTAPFAAGENIDVLTGATITSKAVIDAVNEACAAPENPDAVPFNLGGDETEEPVVETVATPVPAGAKTGTGSGFGGGVSVTLTLNEDGTIATLDIDVSKEVPPVCNNILVDSFINQFIGKTGPFVAGENVDIVSGATFSSNGAIEAVNAALSAPEAEVLTSKGSGFGDGVVVNVTLNEDGTIATLDIDVSGEVPPVCNNILVDSFINQFIGKKGPFVAGEGVDIVSGATFSSNGVIEALNKLFETEAPAEEPVAEPVAVVETKTAKAEGFMDYVVVTVGLAEDGTIATLNIDVSNELPPACDLVLKDSFINQFVGKKGPFVVGEGIDVATGATFSSNGAIAAINSLFPVETEEEASNVLTSKGAGFGDGVVVNVTLNEDGTIATLAIDVSGEVPPMCDLVLADSFVNQFIGKKGPFVVGEGIDVATGATFSSNGVVEALNKLFTTEEAVTEEPVAEPVAVVETKTAKAEGFMDYVVVTVGLAEDGTIATLNIDVSNELPPACDLVLKDSFINQFIGKKGPFVVGEGIDVATGATFSSNGAIAAINSLFPAESGEPADETLTAKGAGFGDGVVVNVTLNEDGTIATLDIDVSGEVPPVCNNILVDSFINQFIGKKGPFVAGEGVDIVTGATFSSNGVIEALNKLFETEAPAEEPEAEPVAVVETKTAKAEGFMDYVVVTVGLAEDGTIATLNIDVSNELPPACDLVLADSFVNQFIGKKGPFVVGEGIDVATGATFSSNGAIAALNSLFPAESEEPADETLTAKGAGFGDGVVVNVTLNEDGTIATLDIDVSGEVPPVCNNILVDSFINQFIGKKGPFVAGEGVDIVSGATFSSNGVIEALNKLFTTEEAVTEEPVAEPVAVVETKTAKAEGFMDYVVVTVGLAEDGTIATLNIDVSNELPPACDLVLKDSFINQFIGKKGPFVAGENVDVATGATYSSNGAIAAINSLFPAETEEEASNVLTSKGSGFGDGVVVNVTLNEDGTIATLSIDVSGEVPPMCDLVLADSFVNQFIGKKGPFVVGEGIDVATGATFSSNGVIEALNKLFPAEAQ